MHGLFIRIYCILISLFLVRFALLLSGADLLIVCMGDVLRNRFTGQSICSVVARTRSGVRVSIHTGVGVRISLALVYKVMVGIPRDSDELNRDRRESAKSI